MTRSSRFLFDRFAKDFALVFFIFEMAMAERPYVLIRLRGRRGGTVRRQGERAMGIRFAGALLIASYATAVGAETNDVWKIYSNARYGYSLCHPRSVGLSSESVACGVEVVLALLRAKEIADFTDGAPEGVDGPDGAGSQKGLQLCESHLDRIEVGAIGRKE
jgi:hypothetical protein